MKRALILGVGLLAFACGPRTKSPVDAGEEDAGVDAGVDAVRAAGVMPPTGYSLAVEQSTSLGSTNRVGASVAMALDQNSQPLLAYVHEDPNGDAVTQDTRVEFTRWSGVDGGFWEAPRTVEVVGQVDTSHPHRQVAMARDEGTGRLGVLYVTAAATVNLAFSDDEGNTWSLETASEASNGALSDPALALNGGIAHLAYHQENQRCASGKCGAVVYRTRSVDGDFSSPTLAPLLSGTEANPALPLSLVVDSTGKPGLAYFLETSSGPTVTLAFWRPGASAATRVIDSEGQGDLQASVSLAFRGELAHLAYHLSASDPAVLLRYSAAVDSAGTGFGTPVVIPRNGALNAPEGTQWYQAISLGSGAQVAIAADFEIMTQSLQQCGGPKLARSNDGTTFTVCSPDGARFFGLAGKWVNLAHDRAGKLNLVFLYENRANPLINAGIILWRQP